MTQTFYPLDNSPILNASQWSKMAQNWLGTGVIKGLLNELQVYADSTGMQVKVKSGQAFIKGHFFESDIEEVLPIGAADSTNSRIDRVIVRLDWVAGTIQLAVLQGIAASIYAAPMLTMNSSRWEISLAQIQVNANVSTIAAGNVTDERAYAVATGALPTRKTYIDVYRPTTVNLNVNSGTRTKMLLTNLATDTLTEFDLVNSKYVAAETGKYQLYFDAIWNTIPAEGETILYLYLNGVMIQKMSQLFNKSSATNDFFQYGATMKSLNAGDILEFYVYQSTGTTQIVQGSVLRIARVG